MKAKILCAAIRLKDGSILRGEPFDENWTPDVTFERPNDDVYSHGGIVRMNERPASEWEGMEAGFLTEDNRFLDRRTAYDHATANRQINLFLEPGRPLFSEDFWQWISPLDKVQNPC